MKAGKYSSMSLARSVAALSVPFFKRQVVDYGLELHKAMASGQSEVRDGIANVEEAELSSTVFRCSILRLWRLSTQCYAWCVAVSLGVDVLRIASSTVRLLLGKLYWCFFARSNSV